MATFCHSSEASALPAVIDSQTHTKCYFCAAAELACSCLCLTVTHHASVIIKSCGIVAVVTLHAPSAVVRHLAGRYAELPF
jgi:hypothetical protein